VSDTPLLEIRDLSKTFGSVQALTDVDFEVRAGEVMALVGDNGAGKSTLIKCIAGIHGYDSGTILFNGDEVHIHGPKDSAKLGIEVVYQDLALCDNLDVVQNIISGWQTNTVYKYVPDEANAAIAAAVALYKGKKPPSNGTRPNKGKKQLAYLIPVTSITKANYTRLFRDGFLKRSDVCSGAYKQYCK